MLFFLVASQTLAQTYNEISAESRHKIDSTYNALLDKHNITGASLAIVDNGRVVYSTGYGWANSEKEIPATDQTVYRIGSITKSFTALAVMQLHAAGKLDYTQPLVQYLPDFSINNRFDDKTPVSISNMMSHTSGLPSDILNGFFASTPPSTSWIIKQLKYHYTIAPPNYVMSYSNTGYALLGELIAQTSEMSYSDYLHNHVFQPLGMSSSYVYFDSTKNHTIAMAYINKKPVEEPLIRDVAAGLIHSNALDMANYTLMFLNNGILNGNEILPGNLLAEMETDRLNNLVLNNGMKYGFGLLIDDLVLHQAQDDSTVVQYIGHGGDTFGYHADFGYIPEAGIGAVILTNTDKGVKIRNVKKLLSLYLQTEKQQKLNTNYIDENALTNNDTPCPEAKVLGVYQTPFGIVEVDNLRKIKFKQGFAKIVMKRDDSTSNFRAKALLLGFIPIKIKGQEFNFVENNGNVFFKAYLPESQQEEYMGVKAGPQPVPAAWRNAFGKYELTGDIFAVPDGFNYDTSRLEAALSEEDGFIVFEMKGGSRMLKTSVALIPLDEHTAFTPGYARNTGTTISLLPNGNLYFSGFEFEKKEK